jgi:nicotinic acid mononucleotide adenylyltransferase
MPHVERGMQVGLFGGSFNPPQIMGADNLRDFHRWQRWRRSP